MSFVSIDSPLYPKTLRVIPAIDPTGANVKLFLTEHGTDRLIQELHTRDYGIETAPLRMGNTFDLYANSNCNLMIAKGEMGVADTLSPRFRLDKIFIEVMGELFAVDVSDHVSAEAVVNVESDTRKVNISFNGRVQIDPKVLTYFGEKPYWLPMLHAETHSLFHIDYSVYGSLELARGTLSVAAHVNDVIWAGAPTGQSKFAKTLTETVKILAYTFKASVA